MITKLSVEPLQSGKFILSIQNENGRTDGIILQMTHVRWLARTLAIACSDDHPRRDKMHWISYEPAPGSEDAQQHDDVASLRRDMQRLATSVHLTAQRLAKIEALANTRAIMISDRGFYSDGQKIQHLQPGECLLYPQPLTPQEGEMPDSAEVRAPAEKPSIVLPNFTPWPGEHGPLDVAALDMVEIIRRDGSRESGQAVFLWPQKKPFNDILAYRVISRRTGGL
jgi:hypothetical protein